MEVGAKVSGLVEGACGSFSISRPFPRLERGSPALGTPESVTFPGNTTHEETNPECPCSSEGEMNDLSHRILIIAGISPSPGSSEGCAGPWAAC